MSDGLAPARGIANGLIISILIWLVIGVGWLALEQRDNPQAAHNGQAEPERAFKHVGLLNAGYDAAAQRGSEVFQR